VKHGRSEVPPGCRVLSQYSGGHEEGGEHKERFMSALDGDAGERLRNKEDTEATWGCGGGSQ
jgi:hypothetical protein